MVYIVLKFDKWHSAMFIWTLLEILEIFSNYLNHRVFAFKIDDGD